MKTHSMQYKFLLTVISAMLAITLLVGGLCIYEMDRYVNIQTQEFIDAECEKEAAQINEIFGDMEKSVRIMESYVFDMIDSQNGIESRDKQDEIIRNADRMFANVAKNTSGAVAYYLRFSPEISDDKTGLFYSKIAGGEEYICQEITDLGLYDKTDIEHVGWYWQPYEAGVPVWMKPYHNMNNDILMISYVVPMYYGERFIGVIGMDFDYTVLSSRVHEIRVYEHGFAHLEADGVLMHEQQEKPGAAGGYLRVSKELVNGMELVLSASYDDIRQIRYDMALKMLLVVLALVGLFALIVIMVVARIVEPLKRLTVASQQLAKGNYSVERVNSNTYEIKVLSAAFEHMTKQLHEHEKVQHLLAYRDSLTGLRNATAYKTWVTDFEKEIKNGNKDFGVVVFDLNYLKETNDSYGHDMGNKLIVSAARIISNTFKRSPVFRIGGDEFLAVLQNSDLQEYEELFARFDAACAGALVDSEGNSVGVSIAKGFSRYNPAADEQVVDVFNRADEAMYKNKREMKAESAAAGSELLSLV